MSGPRDDEALRRLLQHIKTADDFRAYAHTIEADAAERYAELADQMETHNNREVAALFRRLAEIEERHARQFSGGKAPASRIAAAYFWIGGGAESIAPEDLHYLMTPHHALTLALRGEERAAALFEALAKDAPDAEIRRLAAEMAEEERQHVRLMKEWLAKYPEPDPEWHHDPDPPHMTE